MPRNSNNKYWEIHREASDLLTIAYKYYGSICIPGNERKILDVLRPFLALPDLGRELHRQMRIDKELCPVTMG